MDEPKRIVIIRHGPPNVFDKFPHGTLCKVMIDFDAYHELYMQCSFDTENPRWEKIERIKE